MLVEGRWTANWTPVQAKDEAGRFVRQGSQFRNWVTPDGAPGPSGEGGYPAEPGRYHLYVALICPWACRTLMARALLGLEGAIGVTILEPFATDQGWRFGRPDGFARGEADPFSDAAHLHEVYSRAAPRYTGRATVPVLWDRQRRTIVNNESAEILAMLNGAFRPWATQPLDLRPADLEPEIERLNAAIYEGLNDGVYRAGFASSQAAYDEAVVRVFATLAELEARLADGRPYLFGQRLTETDIRLFVTLVRFDPAYHGLFKCNLKRLTDHPHLAAYLRRVLALPGVAGTVDVAHIKAGYHSIKALNPSGIVPAGPADPYGLDAAA